MRNPLFRIAKRDSRFCGPCVSLAPETRWWDRLEPPRGGHRLNPRLGGDEVLATTIVRPSSRGARQRDAAIQGQRCPVISGLLRRQLLAMTRRRHREARKREPSIQEEHKKLHESALKLLESLARVNLRAPVRPHHCSKLALGPASANARPTSSPRSSIEVCSRTERSSPFACRSACSGERATLTMTFDSTSGWR